MENNQIHVGVGIFIVKDKKILLGKRKGILGNGQYAGIGGHLEYMESLEECAKREAREEAGIEIDNIRLLSVTNLKKYAPKHYVDIGLLADWKSGELKNMEPDVCEGWNWYNLDNVPEPLFGCEELYIEAYKTGKNFFDA